MLSTLKPLQRLGADRRLLCGLASDPALAWTRPLHDLAEELLALAALDGNRARDDIDVDTTFEAGVREDDAHDIIVAVPQLLGDPAFAVKRVRARLG